MLTNEYIHALMKLEAAVCTLIQAEDKDWCGTEPWCIAMELLFEAFDKTVAAAPSKVLEEFPVNVLTADDLVAMCTHPKTPHKQITGTLH